MKVEAVQIKHFRSISSCELTMCSGFNVLVGKNNSGKSNILSAINAFFLAVDEGGVICLDPYINQDVDFHNGDSETPVEVALTFLLDRSEIAELVTGLLEDSPQMTNAVNDLDHDSRLYVRLRFDMQPSTYAYVNRISLLSRNWNQGSANSEKVILDVGPDAALELHGKYLQSRSDETRISMLQELLSHVDADDWMQMRGESTEDMRGFRLRRILGPRFLREPETLQSLDSMLRDSSTFQEFRSALEAEIDTLTRFASHSDKHSLDLHSVGTFSGSDSVIPRHVLTVLRNMSAVKVLYVTDNRRPIGRDEAQKLLNLKMQRGGGEHLRRIQEIVSSLLGVQIDAFSSSPSEDLPGVSWTQVRSDGDNCCCRVQPLTDQ